MKVPAKGKAVQYTFNDSSKTIQYSLGTTDSFGNLQVSEYSDGKGRHDTWSKWQEVEITPVVHVPEEGKVCAVWDESERPEVPYYRRSKGSVNCGNLITYGDGHRGNDQYWSHWEEIE